jgi:feruloyl esterase
VAASCDGLAKLALKDTAITKAEVVAAGTFEAPGGRGGRGPNPYKALGRVLPRRRHAHAHQRLRHQDRGLAADSRVERQVSGGGQRRLGRCDQLFGDGRSAAGRLRHGVHRHRARGRPRHVRARSSREARGLRLALRARDDGEGKQVIEAFYGAGPKLSYWNGCSTGGRQGLKAAQMFPEDYNGIIAGAPANRTAISLWIADAVLKDPARYIPPAKYPVITRRRWPRATRRRLEGRPHRRSASVPASIPRCPAVQAG